MEVWQARVTWLALVLAAPCGARADPPATTVWFGAPALGIEVGLVAPTPPVASREPLAGTESEAPVAQTAETATPQARIEPRCPSPVTVTRRHGARLDRVRMPLLDCDGRAREEALRALSILSRSRHVEDAPTDEDLRAWREDGGDPERLADGVRMLHPGLLERLQRIGEAFDPLPIEIVSGYRPESPSRSRHHHGRALDIVVPGVAREALRDLALSFPQTGVGWYPNSVFVHVDVREESAYWVDLSGPGEPPRYVRAAETDAPSHGRGAADEVVRIDEDLETIRRGVRLILPDEPVEEPAPTSEDLDRMRRDTEEALRAIQIPDAS